MKKHADEIPLEPLDDSAASLRTLEEGKQNEEQNVLRQESDGEPIQWDGSEAELVTSGEDEGFEDVQAGIRLEYQLKADEIHCVLKRAKFYRKAMMKAKIETAVLGAMLLLFGLTWILKNDPQCHDFYHCQRNFDWLGMGDSLFFPAFLCCEMGGKTGN